MYFNFTVEIPSVKGKIITKRKGSSTYVLFQYGQKYNPEKKYSIPQRAIIGKVHPQNKNSMLPNEKFQEYFPNAPMPEELPESYRSCALKIGSYIITKKIFQEYNLPQMLKAQFGKDTGLLMDLVSYLIVDEENAGQYYPDFAFNHPLFSLHMQIFSDSKVCRFLKNVTEDQVLHFLNDWNKKRDHRQRIYISYDSTNKNCQAGDVDIIEYGKPKDNQGLPIFNLALAFDKTNRVPLFYETYGGSITDVSQLKCMVDKVNEYGYKHVGFILDRGYFSKENIRYLEDNKYSFILMVKGCKKLVAHLIMEHRGSFETDRDYSIRSYRAYGKTIVGRLYEDDTSDRFFHLYFNPSRQAAEREQLEHTIDKMKLILDKQIREDVTFGKQYHEYFDLKYDKNHLLISYTEKKDVIKMQLELCGYFCLITSDRMTATQALIHYKGRDISEKLFSSDKSFLGSKSMRVQSNESFSAKLFIEFIALIIRNRIYNLLKETMLRLESRPNYMTVPAAIRELEKIEMVRRNNGQYKLDHAVSKRQKTILSSFGMDEETIRNEAYRIEKLLVDNQSLLASCEADIDMNEEVYDDGTDTFDILD